MAKAKTNSSGDKNAPELLKIRFIKSPTGQFRLAYFIGDEVEFPMAFAAELIELGYAEAVGS